MTPQFEAACIAAATLMAADEGWTDPTATAIAAFHSFRQSNYSLGEGMEGEEVARDTDAQNFADWWESITDLEREAACNGDDITDIGDEGTTYTLNGTTISVATDNDVILHVLFEYIGL